MTRKPRPERKPSGGRPPKYDEPSRPITLTLPESTLEALSQIDEDRVRAIVKLASAVGGRAGGNKPLVEVVNMVPGAGLLVIGPSKALRRIPFLHLVEVAPARYLLAMNPGNDFRALELALQDVLEDVPAGDDRERRLIGELLDRIRMLRRADLVSMAEILFVRKRAKSSV